MSHNFVINLIFLFTRVPRQQFSPKLFFRDAIQKINDQDREIVPISSDTPTIETVSEHLDSEYCQAQFQLSAQLKAELALYPLDPDTNPPVKVYF